MTDVITVTPIKSKIQLRDDKKNPVTRINGKKSAKCCHMVGNIDLRFLVELHKTIEKSVCEFFLDHGQDTTGRNWGSEPHFDKHFFSNIIPWFAAANFLEEDSTMWIPFEPNFGNKTVGNKARHKNLFEITCETAKTCKKWNEAMDMHRDVMIGKQQTPFFSLHDRQRLKGKFLHISNKNWFNKFNKSASFVMLRWTK